MVKDNFDINEPVQCSVFVPSPSLVSPSHSPWNESMVSLTPKIKWKDTEFFQVKREWTLKSKPTIPIDSVLNPVLLLLNSFI